MTTAGGAARADESARTALSSRQVALAFVVFLVLFGQPVVVFALAARSPGLPSLVVIAVGTALLAGSVTRLFVRRGGSVDRLADFLLVLAGTQLVLALLTQAALTAVDTATVSLPMLLTALVLVGYPVAYYVVYHGPPIPLLGAHVNDKK
jgi:hypothetical protein